MASRAKKILIRTGVGATLAFVLGWVLSMAYNSTDGFSVWLPGALFTVGCVYELTTMQRAIPKSLHLGLLAGLLVGLAPGAAHFFPDQLPLERWLGDLLPEALSRPYLSLVTTFGTYLACSVVFLVFALATKAGRERFRLCLGLSLWAFVPMTALTFIWSDYGADGLVALLVLSKIGDVFGYYVGSAIGKTHPFPNISPGKTTAGCVASLVVGTLAGGLFAYFEMLPAGSLGVFAGLFGGAFVNLAAQAGDLYESRIKRLAEVKDSGSWFGPSGGVLDLADSLLFSVPAALVTWPVLFA